MYLLFFISTVIASAQTRVVHGYAKDAATLRPIPFPLVTTEDGRYQAMGDMEGHFVIRLPRSEGQIQVRAYSFLPATITPDEKDSARALLHFAHTFSFQTITHGATRVLMKQLRKVRKQIDPRRETNFNYLSYNKFVITSQSILAVKLHMNSLLRLFGNRNHNLGLDHHILLMESAARRNYQDRYHQKETVVQSKVSGINKPPALSLVSGFEAMSIYEPFLRIGTRRYVSPLAGRFNKRYIYFITDSVKVDSEYVYVVKFNPRSLRNKDLLQGFLFISKSPLGVVGFHMWPAFDRESTYSILQQSRLLPSGRWFPAEMKTVYNRSRLGSLQVPIQASSKTYIFNQEALSPGDTTRYSEVIFDFRHSSNLENKDFPIELRQERLSAKDRNTYEFYQNLGSLDAIDGYLTLGQKLMFGRLPMGKIDLVFRKAITVNEVEGLRLGFGLQTTEKLSRTHQGGGYFAYGNKDFAWKYGLNYQYNFSENQSLGGAFQSDLAEPGIQTFAFNKQQYSSEQLRNIRIPRFDRIRVGELVWSGRPERNVYTRLALAGGSRHYLYNYRFLPTPTDDRFTVSEIRWAVRWSPGEQFVRYQGEKFSLGNRLPEFWLQGSEGIPGIANRSFRFTRLEAKTQWTRKILGLGEIGIQAVCGKLWGKVPYPLLFNMRASFKDVSLLTYNSFETMRYNEFVVDRYVNVFISHKFSKMQISTLPFRPYFTLVHNMGWGQVSHPENHEGVQIKGLPRGYYESGLFLNDLFVVPLVGVNLGVGFGAFARYGPYSLPGTFDNLALKFSVNLTL